MDTKVINIKTHTSYDIFGGRPGPLGNPFVIGKDGTRDEVCEKYKIYFDDKIKNDKEFRDYVLSCKGTIIGCYCVPQRCHCSIIADWLNTDE